MRVHCPQDLTWSESVGLGSDGWDPAVEPSPDEPLWRVGDWSFAKFGGRQRPVLVRYDRNLDLVQRQRLDRRVEDGNSDAGQVFQLLDPLNLDVVVSVPVSVPEVCAQWCGDELWIADGRLRVFAQGETGAWSMREVSVTVPD